jgi:hypothetical protein
MASGTKPKFEESGSVDSEQLRKIVDESKRISRKLITFNENITPPDKVKLTDSIISINIEMSEQKLNCLLIFQSA